HLRADVAQACLPPSLSGTGALGLRVRPRLRRLEHRTDADGGRARCHEHHLDVPDHRSHTGAEALARASRCRRACRIGHSRSWYRRYRRALTKETRRMTKHKVGTREDWLAAREQLLVREKEHTRLGDDIAQQRRELPWVLVEKEYRFDTQDGERTL